MRSNRYLDTCYMKLCYISTFFVYSLKSKMNESNDKNLFVRGIFVFPFGKIFLVVCEWVGNRQGSCSFHTYIYSFRSFLLLLTHFHLFSLLKDQYCSFPLPFTRMHFFLHSFILSYSVSFHSSPFHSIISHYFPLTHTTNYFYSLYYAFFHFILFFFIQYP